MYMGMRSVKSSAFTPLLWYSVFTPTSSRSSVSGCLKNNALSRWNHPKGKSFPFAFCSAREIDGIDTPTATGSLFSSSTTVTMRRSSSGKYSLTYWSTWRFVMRENP